MAVDPVQMVDALLNHREVKKAEMILARVLRADVEPAQRAELLLLRARAKLLTGRSDDALEDLYAVGVSSPQVLETPEALELMGDCSLARFERASVGFADRGDTKRALQAYERILERVPDYPNSGWVLYQKGRVLLTDDRVHEAVACFQAALLHPSHMPTLTAYCYERLGFAAFYEQRHPRQALTYLNKAVDTYPAHERRTWLIQVQTLRSRVLREMRRYAEALEAAEKAITVAAASGEPKIELADALLTAGEISFEIDGRQRDAATYLQQFVQVSRRPLGVDVTWSRVHEMLGDVYFRTGQYHASITAYEAALQFNPYHPWESWLHYRIARSHYQVNDYAQAITVMRRMLSAAEADGEAITDYRAYMILGSAQYALGSYADAADAYQKALTLAPTAADSDAIQRYAAAAQQYAAR